MFSVIHPDMIEKWPLEKHKGVISKLLVNGQKKTVLMSHWEPGAIAPKHTHPNEQVDICLQGKIEIIINSQNYLVNAGEFYHIPPSVPHAERNSGWDVAILADFFSLIRSDLIQRHFKPQVATQEKLIKKK